MWQYSCFPCIGVYVSQLIRYSRACSNYQGFLKRALLLSHKLLQQGYIRSRLKLSLLKFYSRHHELVDQYGISVSKLVIDLLPVIHK